MSNEHIGRDTFIEVRGQRYRMVRCVRRIEEAHARWCRAQIRTPIQLLNNGADLAGFDPELRREIALQAYRDTKAMASPASMDEEIVSVANSGDGIAKLAAMLLMEGNPGLTEDDAISLIDAFVVDLNEDSGWVYDKDNLTPAPGALALYTVLNEARGKVKKKVAEVGEKPPTGGT